MVGGKRQWQVAGRPFSWRIVKVPRSKPHSKKLCESKTAGLGKIRTSGGKTKQSGTKGKMRKQKGQADIQNVGKIIKERRDASDANEQTALIKISFP